MTDSFAWGSLRVPYGHPTVGKAMLLAPVAIVGALAFCATRAVGRATGLLERVTGRRSTRPIERVTETSVRDTGEVSP